MAEASTADTAGNREIIRQAFDAWRQGTGAVTAVFAPGMIWRIEGHSAASKEYGSKQQFIDEVLTPFGARFTTSEPFRPVTIRLVYADGDTVIVVWDGRGIATDGLPYENSYVWIMRLSDGQGIDGTAFYDSISFNDLWAGSSRADSGFAALEGCSAQRTKRLTWGSAEPDRCGSDQSVTG
jgi:uncharacterized protein